MIINKTPLGRITTQTMTSTLTVYDYIVLALYFTIILGVGLSSTLYTFIHSKYKQWKRRRNPELETDPEPPQQPSNTAQYFLAGRDMKWWAIGASLFFFQHRK
jgi:hypothetical protein